jgi:hypothetical protein
MNTIEKLDELWYATPGSKVDYKDHTIETKYYECGGCIEPDIPGQWVLWKDGMEVLATDDINDLKLYFDEETNN